MSEKRRKQRRSTTLMLAYSAFFAALSIVFGKYLAISGGDVLRFSFENLPILFAGIVFGPIVGGAVGAVADLLGCLLVGYAINPILTVGAAAIGVLSGLLAMLLNKFGCLPLSAKVIICTGVPHIIGSVIIKTFGLSAFYDIPLFQLMLWRLLNYLIIGVLEGIILWYLLKNKLIISQMNSVKNKADKE